jgi:hypothetical protein
MQSQEKFSLLRSILLTLGLSTDVVDDIVEADGSQNGKELANHLPPTIISTGEML